MAYIFWTFLFFFLFSTVFYLTRSLWVPYAPLIPYLTAPGPIPESLFDIKHSLTSFLERRLSRARYVRLPTSFQEDAEAGLSSAAFDLGANIDAGDSRQGLDDSAKRAVQSIMRAQNLSFDEARRVYVEERFGKENIGRDGRPRDPKAVMFDRI